MLRNRPQMLRNRPMAKIGPKLPGRRAAGFTPDRPDSTRIEPVVVKNAQNEADGNRWLTV